MTPLFKVFILVSVVFVFLFMKSLIRFLLAVELAMLFMVFNLVGVSALFIMFLTLVVVAAIFGLSLFLKLISAAGSDKMMNFK